MVVSGRNCAVAFVTFGLLLFYELFMVIGMDVYGDVKEPCKIILKNFRFFFNFYIEYTVNVEWFYV